ncbi:hypothetical protein PV419_42905 [Streptomyces sp. ME19-01-6]|nr:hypothetical protein [Streptomyces sp. ME19-01-6]MDX3232202.1 hypothetical protein [Streptomyces sp. ME19-01-6]
MTAAVRAVRRGSGREGMQTLPFLGGLVVDGTEDREAAAASGLEPHPVRVQVQHADLPIAEDLDVLDLVGDVARTPDLAERLVEAGQDAKLSFEVQPNGRRPAVSMMAPARPS